MVVLSNRRLEGGLPRACRWTAGLVARLAQNWSRRGQWTNRKQPAAAAALQVQLGEGGL